jgi:ABC-type branched-subunit amino acid transport system substrate-binding protein
MRTDQFYQVGGNLSPFHPTYVKRQADDDLEKAIRLGEYCYILNCRQMGKSSLGERMIQKLDNNEGFACAFISLSNIGTEVTVDQWYATIIRQLANEFEISFNSTWLQERLFLSPLERLNEFIYEVLLNKIDKNIVIIIDEIDTIISLRFKFQVDDLLGLIRSCYNNRANRPEYQRLTFILLGVASPSDLIQDPAKTPFNIGHKIELQGFQLEEVKPLIEGLQEKVDNPLSVMKEILYWTGGQPFLTQKLCQLISHDEDRIIWSNEKNKIANLVKFKMIDNWENQDHPQHLLTIQQRILGDTHNVINLLETYRQILEKESSFATVIDAEAVLKLRLSGLVVQQQNQVKVYNEIYKQVFSSKWIDNQLKELRPYASLINAWFTSDCKDKSQLLRGEAFKNAMEWKQDKLLSPRDYQYLNACQQTRSNRTIRNILWIFAGLSVGILGSGLWFNYKYASCSMGERIYGECFRMIMTSGDEERLFLANTNSLLIKGSKYFKLGQYNLAIKFFKQAIEADHNDPTPLIYFNNTKARLRGNGLKVAVSVPVDYYSDTAKDILRGVADAQNEFNNNGGKNGRLLEIVIANDGNQLSIARKIAENLANQKDIIAVIGHHASETTQAALPIYQQMRLAVVSSTSTSSLLQSDVFFRTVASTKVVAQLYASFIKNNLNLNTVAVFYAKDSLYSRTIYEDFKNAFNQLGGKTQSIIIDGFPLDIDQEIDDIHQQNIRAALLFNNVQGISISIAIAQANFKLPIDQRLTLLAADSLFNDITLKKGRNSVEGMILASHCLASQSQYMINATKRWEQTINWQTATSYDATQAIIEAINRSSNNPTRQEILDNLKSLTIPAHKTSGFGLQWSTKNPSEHFNIMQNYCIYKIHNHKFEQSSTKLKD